MHRGLSRTALLIALGLGAFNAATMSSSLAQSLTGTPDSELEYRQATWTLLNSMKNRQVRQDRILGFGFGATVALLIGLGIVVIVGGLGAWVGVRGLAARDALEHAQGMVAELKTLAAAKDIDGLRALAADFSKDMSFTGQTGYAVGSMWATATPQELWGIRAYFDGRAQDQDLGRGSGVSWEIREGYAQMRLGKFDLRAGRQVTVWGRADKVNPTDAWSTRDRTLLAPNDDDQRLGVASLQATWNAGAYRTIALWQPEWRYPGFPIPPLPLGVSLRNVAPKDPAQQLGIKLDHSGEGLDWSLSYSHSLNRTPDLTVLSAKPQGLLLGLIYRPVSVVGADAAVPVGKFGLRAEVAYTRTQGHGGPDPLAQKRNVFAVVGCERTFDGVLNINAQYLYRRTFDFIPPSSVSNPSTRSLAEQVELLSNQLAPNMHGASLRINHKAWNETLETEIAAVVWFKRGDSAILPKVTYAFTDHLKGIFGGELYHGPRESVFGQLSSKSTAYAEFQIGF